MARIELKFIDYFEEKKFVKVKKEEFLREDLIRIEINNNMHVDLDKSTAIKFAKTLRTEINKIKEVSNG